MKKLLSAIMLFFCLGAFAQVNDPDLMIIHYNNGSSRTVDIRDAEYIEFAKAEDGAVQDYTALLGTWTYPIVELISSGHTYVTMLDYVGLKFEEDNVLYYVYGITTETHYPDSPEDSGTSSYEQKSKPYRYEISGDILTIVDECEMQFRVNYDRLTLTLLNGNSFPPRYDSSFSPIPTTAIYEKSTSGR